MNPTYCPITYSFKILPTISDASVVMLDTTNRRFTVKSNDLGIARAYSIEVTATSATALTLASTFSFTLELVNPCLTFTFTIASNIIAATTTYTLADAEFSFP